MQVPEILGMSEIRSNIPIMMDSFTHSSINTPHSLPMRDVGEDGISYSPHGRGLTCTPRKIRKTLFVIRGVKMLYWKAACEYDF